VALATTVAGYAGDDPVEAVSALLSAREEARSAKDWTRADAVRLGLQELGVDIEDTPAGARVSVRGD
jgi:cysteinyl-tRNA synthetase